MRTRTLAARIERAEQTAKAEHRFSAQCICFPENEPPFFAFEIELEMLTRVTCPIHGQRFKPYYRIYVARWLRLKQPQHLWTHHSEQYRKAWFASFPQDVAGPRGRNCRWTSPSSTKRWEYSGGARTSSDDKAAVKMTR